MAARSAWPAARHPSPRICATGWPGASRASRGASPARVRYGAPDSPLNARCRVRSRSPRQPMPGFVPDASDFLVMPQSAHRLLGSTIVDEEFLLFAGSGSRRLAAEIGTYLGCPLGRSEVLRFQEGNLFVRVLENVRGRDAFLVQGTAFPVNDNFVELLFWIDAFKRA